ncbi:MDR family MFS transporter [Lactobacillus psittaci]|uniref:Major facilitator superfamily transporter permease n=1 Tax=Lactobacillus psittaci DSM 15354 TaxID=1122152 RepID=A0A0R1SF29_9LACO|nr:MDR family MFS transporter [Lactobacillus psittaci]KRL63755.1 major facilitator superfamily transporter permease [Lactobacillus psittaci DSM 15354]
MSRKVLGLITFAIFVTTFMTAVEGTIVSTAMPTIVSDLDGLEIMNWVVSIFLLMTAITTPLYGKLSDRYGRKPIFLFGIFVFVIGSSLCGLAQNMIQLIIYRVIQGIGSGAIQPVAITILADLYPIEKRAKIIGLNSSFWGLASVIAPLLGGFIVQHLSWHWVFYINLPLGILAFILITVFFKEKWQKRAGKLDLQGTSYLMTFLLAFMLFLQGLNEKISLILLLILVVISISSLFLFIKAEKKATDPILPLSMLSHREFSAQNAITLLINGVVMGLEFYIPTWMQGIKGLSASIAGFAVTPSAIMWVVGSFIAGNLMVKIGTKRLISISLLILLLADASLIFIPAKAPFEVFCLISFFHGSTFGSIITAAQVRSQVIVGKENVGVATSFNTLMRYVGQTMMVSVYGIIFNSVIFMGLKQHSQLNMGMMNKVVNSARVNEISQNFIPTLRSILHSSLQAVYLTSFVVIIMAILINQLYREQAK